MPIDFDQCDLEETRRVNRRLAHLPRLRLHHPIHRTVMQSLTKLGGRLMADLPRKFGIEAEDRTVGALGGTARVRILRAPGPPRGVHLHIHGGGWTIGDAQMDDPINAQLAAERGITVVSVDYRLIPAAPFSAVLDDCEIAARWALEEGLDELAGERMTIGGESAGAHLAAVTLLRLRDRARDFARVAGAALTYGCYDLGATNRRRHAGPETLVLYGPTLTRLADKATGLEPEARRAPSLSPLHADLDRLPPALFIVGDKDPLQEDSELMHAKWAEWSGQAELIIVPEAPHGFNHMRTSVARKANAYVRAWIARRHESDAP